MNTNERAKLLPSEKEVERRNGQRRQALLSRDDIERDYNLTRRWLELAALSGDGPPMVRLSRRMIRYQRGAFEDWLATRTVRSTSDPVKATQTYIRGEEGGQL